jgi:hypothetical protein
VTSASGEGVLGRFCEEIGLPGGTARVLVFAATSAHPDAICGSAHLAHRWIVNIAISTTVPDLDTILRVYYADHIS